MPTVRITTSALLSAEQKQELARSVSQSAASIIGKPESYVQVIVSAGEVISFGGDFSAPSVFGVVMSIGGLNPGVCKRLSSEFCETFAAFGIPPERVYLNFTEQTAERWGYNGTTFA